MPRTDNPGGERCRYQGCTNIVPRGRLCGWHRVDSTAETPPEPEVDRSVALGLWLRCMTATQDEAVDDILAALRAAARREVKP